MRQEEKKLLIKLCKEGYTYNQIRQRVQCADGTIKKYIKLFHKNGVTK